MLTRAELRKRRKKAGPGLAFSAARWVAAGLGAALLFWALFLPGASGAVGRALHDALLAGLGPAAYLVPLLVLYALFFYYRTEDFRGLLTLSFGGALSLLAAASLLAAVGLGWDRPDWGGALGGWLARGGVSALGRAGTVLVSLGALILGLQVLFDISWGRFLSALARLLRDDFNAWQNARKEMKSLLGNAAAAAAAAPDKPRIAPIPAAAQRPAEDAPPPAADRKKGPLPIVETPAAESAAAGAKKKRKAAAGGSAFRLPSMDLLQAKPAGAPGGRPSDAEMQEAVTSLQTAFKSFEIDAAVSGIRPGPVITRYEVTPGSGVKVNTILARADDIALATRAKSLRMTLLPGKSAIGMEIPNQRPAMVTLRDVLESKAMTGCESPLAFALGLASDGTPLTADLQTMPHVLIAGATNSGKSVMVHSLIASLLFRQSPDQVKLVLIDPKRIELTLYDGIPHLYDPKIPPNKVQVITGAKQASAALKALVKVMEDRYEKFQAYRVRSIQQFNEEAARRGDPAEFFIVVVIDELADLMVVARDVVEDSIQRLTQMARAVGIHMVIATQRPSVDVLTGVIKANLPSRIAMRVASKIDSKVVLDTNGAEALLGKGDAIYLTPGLDPARIQGCFVSTQEIGALVDYLKTQGAPEYTLLDPVSSVEGEADLSEFGVEPLEFTQALKLVLERRRVSQDLLKSQFGSSARATNILSLLEIKGFIQKPEGSNKWNIHFEKIEDCLRRNYPQVDLSKPGI
ncbi:MAG: hypothetical protein A2X36_15665 [Elusimicrobia bacterium GWA2_69_24]|nr:MAG: hypothetical protein A2X36_15665 [Elusimicrobia bacterium GWA2_69_24]